MRLSLQTTLRIVLLICLLAAPLGCAHFGQGAMKLAGYQKIETANAQIAQVKADEQVKIQGLESQLNTVRQDVEKIKQEEAQEAANHIFGGLFAYTIDPAPGDIEQIMHGEEVAAATTLPSPSAITVTTKMDQVKKLLADKQHLIDNLNQQAIAAQAKATQLQQKEQVAETQIATLTDQKAKVAADASKQVEAIQVQKDKATNEVITKQNELLSNKAQIDAIKLKLTIAAGILAALFAAAAVFSPLMKLQLGELAGIFGAVAIAIPFIQPWMIATALGVGLLVVTWHFVATHTNIVNTVPDPVPTPPKTT